MAALRVLLGAVTLLPNSIGVVLSVVALMLGAIAFVRDVRLLYCSACSSQVPT